MATHAAAPGPVVGCNTPLTEKSKRFCDKCRRYVCVEHQFPIDHDCAAFCKQESGVPKVAAAPKVVVSAGPRSLLPKDYFEAGDGLLVKQIFEAFDRDEDGLLNQEEYGAFCAATEGAGCDDKRWAAHSKSLGSEGTPLKKEDFAKLYTEARFKKHFGKQQQDLEAAQAAPKSDAASDHFDEMEEKAMMADAQSPEALKALLTGLLEALTSPDDCMLAAHGLAGAVKGAGVTSLGTFGVMSAVSELAGNKKSKCRAAGLKAIQLLLAKLGNSCLPFVIHTTGEVLDASEGGGSVVTAAKAASLALVKTVLPHDIQIMLPYIMARFEAKWKTKVAALEMLEQLAQRPELASGMHSVMPVLAEPLIECNMDTHPKTSIASGNALEAVTATIDNQETQKLRADLISAVTKGGDHAAECLALVMELTFVNAIGAPSLALFVPMIIRGLRDGRKSHEVKNAAMCAVNILGLVQDPRQIRPFLTVLTPALTATAEHTHPDVREKASLALKVLNENLGGEDEEMQEKLRAARDGIDKATLQVLSAGPCADVGDAVQKYCALVAANIAAETMPCREEELQALLATALGPVLADDAAVGTVSADIAKACAPFTGASDVDRKDNSGKDFVLNLEGMILAFGGRVLLKMTDLCLERGRCYGFVGQNGVGKTTLLTRIAAKDIDGIPQSLKVYYVAHEELSESNETVVEFMKRQVPSGVGEDEIVSALSTVGFTAAMRNSGCSDLSGGWRMKLAIARSLMWKPELLLLDEPTNHLDHKAVQWLTDYIVSLRGKITVGLVSHEYSFLGDVLTDVVHMCDQTLEYHAGGFKAFQQACPEIVAALPSTQSTLKATQGTAASDSAASLASGDFGLVASGSAASLAASGSAASLASMTSTASSLSLASDTEPEPEPEPEPELDEEVVITFQQEGPIGIVFHLSQMPLTVEKPKPGSQAEAMAVQPGWVVQSVEGVPTEGRNFAGAMELVKNKTRPLSVTFRDPVAAKKNQEMRDRRPPEEFVRTAFEAEGPIGIVFKLRHKPLTVVRTKPGSQGEKMRVQQGWVVKAVNDAPADGLAFQSAMELMKSKDRPLVVIWQDPVAAAKLAILAKEKVTRVAESGIGKQRGGNANTAIPSSGLKTIKKGSKKDLRNMVVEGAKEGTLPILFPNPGKLQGVRGKTAAVMKMTGCQFQYPGADKLLLSDATIKLSMGSRCALLGVNGAGKTTLMKLLVGELTAKEGVGEHWMHHNLRLSYVAQHSMHHLESCLDASPAAYIQRRFADGQDKELLKMERMALTKEEEALRNKRGNVKEVIDRQLRGKQLYYGVTLAGKYYELTSDGFPNSKDLDWIPESNLVHKDAYVQKLRRNCDETIKARNSGMELRPTTLAEVKSHLEDFGISGDLAVGKIKRMSGGQKSRLVLAAAMWSMPHFLALDEPTNYLDNDTLAALTQALKSFKGGVITISHNEAFVRPATTGR